VPTSERLREALAGTEPAIRDGLFYSRLAGLPLRHAGHRTKDRNPAYVIRAPKHLIIALRQTLQQLETTVPHDADQANFAELKRILNQRITDLEHCDEDLPTVLASSKSKQAVGS
jgi:hypothetical protein